MSTLTRPLTYEDLAQTPDDGNRYEIIDGELIVNPAPVPKHQQVSYRLSRLFGDVVDARGLGTVYYAPLDVRLSPYDIVQPDLVFIAEERSAIIGPTFIDGAPDLLVEILSPSSRARDDLRKARLYAASGVRDYWLVDLETPSITVHALNGHRYEPVPAEAGRVRSLVLPDLVVDVAALFAGLK